MNECATFWGRAPGFCETDRDFGIEYIDMQLISEAYMLMRTLLGVQPDELSRTFAGWNIKSVLDMASRWSAV
jgi:6-phosphogluconate dehydrogenase